MTARSGPLLTDAEIQEIANTTIGQRNNPLWLNERRHRLTGSQFNKARVALKKGGKALAKFIHKWVNNEEATRSHLKAIKWGVDNEDKVIAKYKKQSQYDVRETGLWLFPNRILGASPDAIVYPNKESNTPIGILEVKCPYSAVFKKPVKYLYWNEDTQKTDLHKEHAYYDQIQGQLFATKVEWCDLAVWSPHMFEIVRVFPDIEWRDKVLPELEKFYKDMLEPALPRGVCHYVNFWKFHLMTSCVGVGKIQYITWQNFAICFKLF